MNGFYAYKTILLFFHSSFSEWKTNILTSVWKTRLIEHPLNKVLSNNCLRHMRTSEKKWNTRWTGWKWHLHIFRVDFQNRKKRMERKKGRQAYAESYICIIWIWNQNICCLQYITCLRGIWAWLNKEIVSSYIAEGTPTSIYIQTGMVGWCISIWNDFGPRIGLVETAMGGFKSFRFSEI